MELKPGAKLGPYEIVSLLGRGGMGEVWRARDPQVGRDVAIKVSAKQFTDRFEREVRAIGALNHPNICTLYHVGPNYLVLELVEGPTLAERIKEGPIPLDEALALARQIADALEAAHEKGIIHRDLKPANIKLRPDGSVKVLDFGLARIGTPQPEVTNDSPTIQVVPQGSPTILGTILGTAAYMAPEQARGKTVDKRADIWAFGVVLFEMLTGKRLFEGEDLTDTLASVVKSEPDLSAAPPQLRRLLTKCLQKDPRKRLRDIGDAWELLETTSQPEAKESAPPPPAKRYVWPWVSAVLSLAVAGLGFLAFAHLREQPAALVKLEFPPPERGALIQNADQPAVSPDGKRVAFAARVDGKRMLWLRDLDSDASRMLPGTEDAAAPFWSPDSRQVAFFTASFSRLMKIDVTGGPPVTVVDKLTGLRAGTWNQNNVIVFGQTGAGLGLFRVSAAGGNPTPVTEPDASRNETGHRWPHFLPDGRHFLYTALSSNPEKNGIFVGDLESKETKLVLLAASNVAYAEPAGKGYLLFARESTLMAQPFDSGKLAVSGDAVPIAEHVEFTTTTSSAYFGASKNGVLAYADGKANFGLEQITWYDRSGKVVGTVGKPVDIWTPRLSPNGKMIATDRLDPQTNGRDIWVYDLSRGSEQRLTFGGLNTLPVWSPDGQRIAYTRRSGTELRGRGSLVVKFADGTGREEEVEVAEKGISAWTRDGRFLLTMTPNSNQKTGGDIWALPLSGPDARKPVLLRQTEFNETRPQASPDGRWLAYQSDESKRNEVYVMGFPALTGHWQVSVDGGTLPVWNRDGRELYFVSSDNKMMAVEIKPGTQFQAGVPKPLFDVRLGSTNASYDVSADGRFLIATPLQQSATLPITVVLNWQAGLKK